MSEGIQQIWRVCELHSDVLAHDLAPSSFAISLHHVEQGTADRDYADPERFFQKTFITASLGRLLEGVLARLAGVERQGAPILQLETHFGGGKTHAMTAIFHLVRHPEVAEGEKAFQPILANLNIRAIPRNIRVAILDGRGLDVRERRPERGIVIRTLWGELGYRLGQKEGYALMADADRERLAPGSEVLTEFLRHYQPFVILMDEVLEYLVKARSVKVGDSSLMEQTGTFLAALTAAVSTCSRGVLIASLPASSLEVPAESSEAARRLFQYAKKVLGRLELIEVPVAQDEIFGVLRKRLFSDIGNERKREKAVDALQGYYNKYAHFFPKRLCSLEYKKRMLLAYPFHPVLIDLLYERWGLQPQFQRTRGILRLLALVLRHLWRHRPNSALLVQPHHLDFSDPQIRGEIVKLLGSCFEPVIVGDILRRAAEVEQKLGGDYDLEALGKGAATCALLYGISADAWAVGATEEEISTALLRPDVNPAMVSEVLGRLREELWYLRCRDKRYYFTARPNLNKIILDYESTCEEKRLEQEFDIWLRRVAGRNEGTFQVVVATLEPTAVPDYPRPTLVVLRPEVENDREWMKKAVQYAGKAIRKHKNMLIFLAALRDTFEAIRSVLKRWWALQYVSNSCLFKDLSNEDKEQLKEQLKDKEAELETLLLKTYARLYRPTCDGVEEVLLRQTSETFKVKTLSQIVELALKQEGILSEALSPEFLVASLQSILEQRREVSLQQVEMLLTSVPGKPIVKDPRRALTRAIQEGVRKGIFGIRIGDKVCIDEEIPAGKLRGPNIAVVPLSTPPLPSLRPTQPLTLRVRTVTRMLYPLLQAADKLRGVEASVVLEVQDQAGGELAKIREELDKLFRDYNCTVEWREETSENC
ncbi:MAG: ATP-binding protein [Blastocatellia bacterium]|nr:ATP-binding protein [Blastocatellia bacterium]